MKRQTSRLSGQKGFVLVYMAATLTTLLLFAGLAVDTGRAYVVKAQLTKAVDGAALAAARSLNSGVPRNEAVRVFKIEFPGWLSRNHSRHRPGDHARLLRCRHQRGDWREHRDRDGLGDRAHDVHASGEFHRPDGDQLWRGDAPHGRSVARSRRVRVRSAPSGGQSGMRPGRSSTPSIQNSDRFALLHLRQRCVQSSTRCRRAAGSTSRA